MLTPPSREWPWRKHRVGVRVRRDAYELPLLLRLRLVDNVLHQLRLVAVRVTVAWLKRRQRGLLASKGNGLSS